jgi:hypothetical protein
MFSSNTTQVSDGGYQISRSLRFDSAASAYLNRTPSSASNQKTWTWSGWVKRSTLGTNQTFFNAGGNGFVARFNSSTDYLEVYNYSGAYLLQVITAQVFKDVSAWYHIVIAIDTTQATDTNRFKLYVNGSQVTSFYGAPTYPIQNEEFFVNGTNVHALGVLNGVGQYFDGYMTEVNFVNAQQLTPSSFGETNAQTGVWQPKAYSGSYGTNGFYLNFSDNSNTTAATLGKDYSGNGNNWTPNNFLVSVGPDNDSLVDSPTSYGVDTGVGGTVRGNYSTLNPLYAGATGITNGNLDVTLSGRTQYGSMSFTTGKWYWEVTPTASLSGAYLGVMDSTFIKTDGTWDTTTTSTYVNNGNKYGIGGVSAYGASYTTGDVIGFALDLDAGTMVFYKNGASQGTATSGMTGREWRPMLYATGGTYACNFGQRPFVHAAPSGFKALCTQNLPTPTIGATTATLANKYFGVTLRNGGGTSGGTYSTTIDMASGALLWDKPRSLTSSDYYLVDSVRGTSKTLSSNLTNAESNYPSWFTSFNNGSFTTGSVDWNTNVTVVDWIWAANGSGSTNTAGSITSTVSANTTSGFSIITWTGNATQNATIGHGLGAKPALIIVKNRSSGPKDWPLKFKTFSTSQYMYLNGTGAVASYGFYFPTEATSSVIYLGSDADVNGNGNAMVCYAFSEIAGYSAFGSYVGNGSASGPFVYTGFRPAFLLIRSTGVESWFLFDVARGTYNDNMPFLQANTNGPEYAFDTPEIMSNGFKLSTSNASVNGNGNTMIYAAFAETPFKYALAR